MTKEPTTAASPSVENKFLNRKSVTRCSPGTGITGKHADIGQKMKQITTDTTGGWISTKKVTDNKISMEDGIPFSHADLASTSRSLIQSGKRRTSISGSWLTAPQKSVKKSIVREASMAKDFAESFD